MTSKNPKDIKPDYEIEEQGLTLKADPSRAITVDEVRQRLR
jgi:hypothetical protein